jgi:hypothetical protein
MDFEQAFNIDSIQLEPRLQEYIRRKKFNEENDIEPQIPEEQEFCITPHDLKIIKRYKQGKKNLYTPKRLAKDPNLIKPSVNNFDFEVDFKKDPRYQRLQKKMQSHKDAKSKISNLKGIDEDYTIFHQTNPYDLRAEKRPSRIAKPYHDPDNDNLSDPDPNDQDQGQFMMDSRDMVLGRSRPVKRHDPVGSRDLVGSRDPVHDLLDPWPQTRDRYLTSRTYPEQQETGKYCYNPNRKSSNPNQYNHPPKIAYNQYIMPQKVNGGLEHRQDISDIIGNIDSYNKHLNNTYEYIRDDADLDTKTFTPGVRTGTQREMQSGYQSIPFMYGNGLPDVTLEDSLRGGIRDTSKKSVGFKNPFEHQFNYISRDIADPDHTVNMWPQTTRGKNREMARPHSKAVQSEKRIRQAARRC